MTGFRVPGPLTADAVVVGGGLVGCLASRALSAAGLSVLLCERGDALGRQASWAAAGMLAPQMEGAGRLLASPDEAGKREAMWALCLAARDGYRGFVHALEVETGRRIAYRDEGALVVALDEAAAGDLEDAARRQRERGLRAELLPGEEARRLEPLLAPQAHAALYLPDDHQVDNAALSEAAAAAVAASPRIQVRVGTAVRAIVAAGGRAAGVALDGDRIAAPVVVLAAGAWSGALEGLPRPLPVEPVKGQMAALHPPAVPTRIVAGPGVYCVPRENGRLLLGATIEHTGFDTSTTDDAIAALVAAAATLLPSLEQAPVTSRWAGLRPGTPDGLPVLGEDPALPGLVHATGHYRNGILLAPLTSEIVRAVVAGAPPPVELSPFAPDRRFAS